MFRGPLLMVFAEGTRGVSGNASPDSASAVIVTLCKPVSVNDEIEHALLPAKEFPGLLSR